MLERRRTVKTEQIVNDDLTQRDDRLNDLPVTEEQGEEAKGGIVPTTQISLNYAKVDYK